MKAKWKKGKEEDLGRREGPLICILLFAFQRLGGQVTVELLSLEIFGAAGAALPGGEEGR